MQKALPGFVEDKQRDSNQGQCIGERGQNSGAMIAVGLHTVGGLGLQNETQGGQRDGQGVGEIVSGVGNQRQAGGANPRQQLNYAEQQGRVERPLQHLPSPVVMMVVQAVSCASILTHRSESGSESFVVVTDSLTRRSRNQAGTDSQL